MKQIKSFRFFLLLALLVRLFFFYHQFSGDVRNHFAWANGFLASPLGFYSRHFPGFNDPNYPPLMIVLFAVFQLLLKNLNLFFGFLNHTFSIFPSFLVPLFSSENMQMGFLKLPAILADLGVGLLLYRTFELRKAKNSLFLVSLYLFNPAVIYISSVWGQVESVTVFFLLLSLYHVIIGSKNNFLSVVFFAFAVLAKQTAFWFLPLYLFLWLKELEIGNLFKGMVFAVLVFVLSYLPFGLNPFSAAGHYFSTLSGSSRVVSDAAWNLWSFFYPVGTDDTISLGLFSVRQVSIFLLLVILTLIIFRLIKHYSFRSFLNYLFLWSLAVFFFQTRVHERHLAFSLVFLLLTPGLTARYFIDFFILTLYHFSNLYFTLRLPFI